MLSTIEAKSSDTSPLYEPVCVRVRASSHSAFRIAMSLPYSYLFRLFSPEYTETVENHGVISIVPIRERANSVSRNCHYIGGIVGDSGSQAVFSTCGGGIDGRITTSAGVAFDIRPVHANWPNATAVVAALPVSRRGRSIHTVSHVVRRTADNEDSRRFCGVTDSERSSDHNAELGGGGRRRRASVPGVRNKQVEVLLVNDASRRSSYNEYVLAVVGVVCFLFVIAKKPDDHCFIVVATLQWRRTPLLWFLKSLSCTQHRHGTGVK